MTFTTQSICYDNTRLSDYKSCPRKYMIRHVLHWVTETDRDPLVFGLSWHEAMDVVWKFYGKLDARELTEAAHINFMKCWQEQGYPIEMNYGGYERFGARTPGTAKEMLWEYIHNPARINILRDGQLLAVEQPFAVPVPNVKDTWYVGRLDKVTQYNSQTLAIEHKSTTSYATDGGFRPDYIDSWFASSQVKGYQFGGGLYYPSLGGVWVDAALVHKKVHDAFRFIPVSHNITLLQEWLGNTTTWITAVTESTRKLRAGHNIALCFPKNEDSCFGKYGQCEYLDICRTCPNPAALDGPPPGFKEEKWEPFNLLGLDKLVQDSKETNDVST
jgi:hypothetical protein